MMEIGRGKEKGGIPPFVNHFPHLLDLQCSFSGVLRDGQEYFTHDELVADCDTIVKWVSTRRQI